jgi:hypothetical protein
MITNDELKNQNSNDANRLLAAAAVDLRKFCWVGKNKHFNQIMVSQPMTTEDLLTGNYLSFFAMSNREKGGNCEFIMEIFEGDNLIYYGTNMSGLTAKIENGKFVGEGPFNTHPLEIYFNADDFINMEQDISSCS